jgi:hypothetical protein
MRTLSSPACILLNENGIHKIAVMDEIYIYNSNIIIVDGGNAERHKLYVEMAFNFDTFPIRFAVQVSSLQMRFNEEDDMNIEVSQHTMAPWTLKEFESACRDDLFYQSVGEAFEGLQGETKEDTLPRKTKIMMSLE